MGHAATIETFTSSYNIIDLGSYRPEKRPKEQGVLPKDRTLFLGGGSRIGSLLTELMACAGYPFIIGTQEESKLIGMQNKIHALGGVVPEGFTANLLNHEAIDRAWDKLNLPRGERINFFPWSVMSLDAISIINAAGKEVSLKRRIGEEIVKVRRGTVTLEEGTENIRGMVQSPEVLDQARKINEGILYVVDKAEENGNLQEGSLVAPISSSLSDRFSIKNLRRNTPALYIPIGVPKEELVISLREKAARLGWRFINFIAPEVDETTIAIFLDGVVEDIREAMKKGLQRKREIPLIPKIALMDLVETIYGELVYRGSGGRNGDLYVAGYGVVSSTRFRGWGVKYPL